MKPPLTKFERKALRFAYELMRGEQTQYLPYVHGFILRRQHGKLILLPGYWIEPDCDPDRPYLNEITFSNLSVRGYLDCQQFLPGPMWLYRLSYVGCSVIGWQWPLARPRRGEARMTPQERRRQQEGFAPRRTARSRIRETRSVLYQRRFPFRHPVYNRLFK